MLSSAVAPVYSMWIRRWIYEAFYSCLLSLLSWAVCFFLLLFSLIRSGLMRFTFFMHTDNTKTIFDMVIYFCVKRCNVKWKRWKSVVNSSVKCFSLRDHRPTQNKQIQWNWRCWRIVDSFNRLLRRKDTHIGTMSFTL